MSQNAKKEDNDKDKFIKITSTGIIDFDIIVSLSETEAEQMQFFPDRIDTLKDCKQFFLPADPESEQMSNQSEMQKKINIYDCIKLNSNSKTINSLLFVNRAFKKKAFIEYVTMSELKFQEGEEFLREVVKNITEQNFLFLVENDFLPNLNSKISMVFKIENKIVKKFDNICKSRNETTESENIKENKESSSSIVKSAVSKNDKNDSGKKSRDSNKEDNNAEEKSEEKNEEKNDEEKNEEKNEENDEEKNKEKNENEENENEENDNENKENENENKENDNENKENENEKSSSKKSEKINEENENTPNLSKESNNNNNNKSAEKELSNKENDNLIEDLKNKNNDLSNSKSINQPEENQENPEKEVKKEPIFDRFKYDFNGSDYFFVDINEIFELKLNGFTIPDFYELIKKIAEDFKQISIIINFPNIIKNIGYLDLESINVLNEIISLTDVFIFDKKDALALFNLMAQINSEEDNYEDKKNLEHLFIKEIKKKRKKHPKIGIFLDDLRQVTIIEQSSSNLILYHTDYDFKIIPQNITKNVNSDYKKLFVVHYEYLKSVFIGGLFSRILYKKPFSSGFHAGNESLKRVVELLRFDLDFPADPNFFLIKIKKNSNEKDKDKKGEKDEDKIKKKKEQHFNVDSTNIINSKMSEYNPLHDNNLISYFSSKYIRKHLKNLGFINKKGAILEDPDNKKLGVIESKKLNRAYEEEKENLQKIRDRKEKMKIQIKNLLQGNHLMKNGNMKEIEKLAKVYNFYPQAEKKLPSVNDYKKSINKNIKLNSQIYQKEIQKGKQGRSSSKNSKSIVKTIGKSAISNNLKDQGKNLLDVIEKIEDRILYDITDKLPKNIDKNINEENQDNDIDEENNINDNNDNEEQRSNNEFNNIDTNNIDNADSNNNNIISNNDLITSDKKSNAEENSNNKSKVLSVKSKNNKSSRKEYSQKKTASNLEKDLNNNEKSVFSDDKVIKTNNNLDEDLISRENMPINQDDDIIKEDNLSEKKLNLDESKIENNDDQSLIEKNMENLSKISQKNDVSGTDLNESKNIIANSENNNSNENNNTEKEKENVNSNENNENNVNSNENKVNSENASQKNENNENNAENVNSYENKNDAGNVNKNENKNDAENANDNIENNAENEM